MLPKPYRPWRVVYVPVHERRGGLFPLLFLSNGLPSATAALWTRAMDRERWSDSKIERHLRTIGALHAFYEATYRGSPIPSDRLYELVCDFADLRFRGSCSPDGTDSLGLFWPRIDISLVADEIRAINRYSDFVAHYLSLPPLNPEEQEVVKSAQYYRSAREQGRSDAMVHLRGIRRRKRPRRFETRLAVSRSGANPKNNRPKYISPHELVILVEEGCRNARDKMLVLLMGYGGLRISEPLHLFLNDATERFRDSRAAKIRLEHPSNGFARWSSRGNRREGRRSEFLSEMFGRLPRNELGRGNPQFAGWKGMLLPDANPDNRYLFWLDEAVVGRYFRELLEEYLEDHRVLLHSGKLKHPYLFFNIRKQRSSGVYGAPLTLANAHEAFESAAKRARVKCSPHGCRHHYAFYAADVLGLPQETLMRMLHHSSITSSDAYFARDPMSVRREILGVAPPNRASTGSLFPSHWGSS